MPFFEPNHRRSRKICVFVGRHTDYVVLKPLLQRLDGEPNLAVSIVVAAGSAPWPDRRGSRVVEADGFRVEERLDLARDGETATALCMSVGLGVLRLGDLLHRMAPHLVVVFGDRGESFAVATAAKILDRPVAHIDDVRPGDPSHPSFRRAVATLSQLHFVATEADARRLVTEGAEPNSVFHVGDLAVDQALVAPVFDRATVLRKLRLPDDARYLFVSYRPEADAGTPGLLRAETEVLTALDRFPALHVVMMRHGEGATSEAGSTWTDKVVGSERFRLVDSLGATLAVSTMRLAEVVVGNGSDGIVLAPSLAVPTVDIGGRQQGRLRPESVRWCPANTTDIADAIEAQASIAGRARAARADNPYEKVGTAAAIAAALATMPLDLLRPSTLAMEAGSAVAALAPPERDPLSRSNVAG